MRIRRTLSLLSTAAVFASLATFAVAAPAAAAVGNIAMGPSTGITGSTVTITGSNFTADRPFTVKFGTTNVKTGQTDAAGSLSSTFQVPGLARGQYSVTVTTTAPDTSTTETFTITPEIRLTTNSAAVGDQASVSGTGFRASSTVTFFLDNTSAGTVNTDTNGAFTNASFTVPAIGKGQHQLTGRDSVGSSPALPFTTSQTMTVNPVSGVAGDKLTLTGRGFAANSLITVTLDGQPVSAASVSTDVAGSFTTNNLQLPALKAGKHAVKAADAAGNESSAEIAVTHRLSISPITGTPGTTVRITGDGFSAGQAVTVTYGDSPVTTNPGALVTNDKGAFTGSFEVPGGLTGSHAVVVSDGTNTASADFDAVLDTTISQTTSATEPGHVGMELTVNGAGFKPNSPVNVTLGKSPVVKLATVTSDGVGAFSAVFAVPAVKNGQHTITATDGVNTREFDFVMENEAPPIPAALSPDPDVKARRPVHFVWRDVEDDSGVTYSLQVAPNDKFEDLLLEKTGLVESEYILSQEEDLESVIRQTPYFWRVSARDSAANQSDWSEPASFFLGTVLTLPNGDTNLTMSALMVYITAAIILAVLAGVFWLGRRFSRRKIIISGGPVVAVQEPLYKELPQHKESDVYN